VQVSVVKSRSEHNISFELSLLELALEAKESRGRRRFGPRNDVSRAAQFIVRTHRANFPYVKPCGLAVPKQSGLSVVSLRIRKKRVKSTSDLH